MCSMYFKKQLIMKSKFIFQYTVQDRQIEEKSLPNFSDGNS